MNRRRKKAVAIVLGSCIFCCLPVSAAGELSRPVYDVIEELDVKVAMSDGVRLSTNIYRPDTAGKFPALLVRTPYGNGGPGLSAGHYFAERGYAVVFQDTRGRFESEGVFDPFRREAQDGYDTQQWLGLQPWCNGRIGTTGGSYLGTTQWTAAALQSPYLVAMFPEVACIDLYETVYQGGAFKLRLWTWWSFRQISPYDPGDIPGRLDQINLSLPLLEQDTLLGWRVSNVRDYLRHPTFDRYWESLSMTDKYKNIKSSNYLLAGWYDFFKAVNLNNFRGMTQRHIAPQVRKRQKIIVGPWGHGISRDGKLGDLDFGKDAVIDARQLRLRWFDSELKGKDTGIWDEPPVRIFVMGENLWRYENEWPLERTNYRKYYLAGGGGANSLHGDGVLSKTVKEDAPADTFTYDPGNPVPTLPDGSTFNPFAYGPTDHRQVEERRDILVYSTTALKKDIEVTGPVEVILYAASSAANTDFTAKLLDVYADGRAIYLCDGILRASYRNGNTITSNILPGKVYEYHIDLGPTSNVFRKGHRIRVDISSSNFPRFDRNLNTGGSFARETTWVIARQTIFHSRKYPSCIVLPVIP